MPSNFYCLSKVASKPLYDQILRDIRQEIKTVYLFSEHFEQEKKSKSYEEIREWATDVFIEKVFEVEKKVYKSYKDFGVDEIPDWTPRAIGGVVNQIHLRMLDTKHGGSIKEALDHLVLMVARDLSKVQRKLVILT
jgi:hypothetical protein